MLFKVCFEPELAPRGKLKERGGWGGGAAAEALTEGSGRDRLHRGINSLVRNGNPKVTHMDMMDIPWDIHGHVCHHVTCDM